MKKLISISVAFILLMAMTVTALAAFPDPNNGNVQPWKDAESFSPVTYDASKASGTITIDASATKEAGYDGASKISVECHSDQNGMDDSTGCTGEAYVAWDSSYLYLHINVKDKTKHVESSAFESDSVEIYLDYNQKSDGKKVKWNKLSASDSYAAQYRVQRDHVDMNSFVSLFGNDAMNEIGSRSSAKTKENGTNGYIVEVKIPLTDKSGKVIPVSGTIGLCIQINDDVDGNGRDAATYPHDSIQYWAYEYTHLFDNVKLKDSSSMTWSTRKVVNTVSERLSEFDPNSKPASSAKPSSTAPAPSSTAPSVAPSSEPTSTEVSSEPETTVSSEIADTNDKQEDADTNDGEADDATNTIGASDETKEDKGGLSTGALIGIIAGGVVLLAAIVVVVFVVTKKKKK